MSPDRVAPQEFRSLSERPLLQYGLGLGLRNGFDAVVRSFEYPEVDRPAAEVPLGTCLDGAESGQNSALVEDLHGPGGETQPAGLPGALGKLFEHHDVDAAEPQLTGQHQTGRTRAHDNDRCIHVYLPGTEPRSPAHRP